MTWSWASAIPLLSPRLLLSLLLISLLFGCATAEDVNLTGLGGKPPPSPSSAEIVWRSFGGPENAGRVNDLVQDPEEPNRLYLVTSGPGERVFRSEDRGETWEQLSVFDGHHTRSLVAGGGRFFACGDRIYEYDGNQLLPVAPENVWCSQLFLIDDHLYVVANGQPITSQNSIKVGDLTQMPVIWTDISPTAAELSDLVVPPVAYGTQVTRVARLGDRLFAAIHLQDWGTQELSNGRLFYSDDDGETWQAASLEIPVGGWFQALGVDASRNRVAVGVRHPMQEMNSPLREMLFHSLDGGATWSPVTDSTIMTASVSDIEFKDGDLYATFPENDRIIRITPAGQLTEIPGPNMRWPDAGISFGADELLFDIERPSVSYIITGKMWEYGAVKSTDGMRSWTKMERGIVASSPTIVVPHPHDPDTIYSTGNIIQEKMYTVDGGDTWDYFVRNDFRGDEVRIDPHNTDHLIYMSEGTDLFESYDGGASFTRVANEFRGSKISEIQVAADGTVYAAALGIGLSREPALAWESWLHLRRSPDYSYVFRTHPTDADRMIAAQSPRIFEEFASIHLYDRSEPADQGWREAQRFPGATGITALDYLPGDPGVVYAGVTGRPGGLYRSTDGGASWSPFAERLTFSTIHAIAADPGDERVVYAAPWGGGLFRSDDAGASWTEVASPTPSIDAIVVDPEKEGHLYIGDRMRPVVYESQDAGRTWQKAVALDEEKYYRLGAMALHDGELYFSVFNRMDGLIAIFLKGPMSGDTFVLRGGQPVKLEGSVKRVVIGFASDDERLYAVTHIEGVHLLEGVTWRRIGEGLPDMGFNQVWVDEEDVVYVQGGCDVDLDGRHRIGDDAIINNIYASADGGATWRPLLEKNPFRSGIKALMQSPENPELFYAATGTGLYLSRDRGLTWTEQNRGLGFVNIGALAVTPGFVYVGTLGGGVYAGRIDDEGAVSWMGTSGPTPEIHNIQLTIDPSAPETMYATSYPGGVFKTTDSGVTWIESNFALPTFTVTDPKTQGYYSLAIDPRDSQTLYLGLFGKGIYKSYDGGGVWFPLYGSMGQNRALMEKPITKVLVDGPMVYATSLDGIYKSENGGASWSDMNRGLPTREVKTIRSIPASSGTYSEDFDDGDADMRLDGEFRIENGMLVGGQNGFASFGPVGPPSFTFATDVRLHDDGVVLRFTQDGEGSLWMLVRPEGVQFHMQQGDEVVTVANAPVDIGFGSFHRYTVIADGNRYRALVDGREVLSYVSASPLTNGFSFHCFVRADFDNVEIAYGGDEPVLYAGTNGYGVFEWKDGAWSWLNNPFGGGYWDTWDRRIYQFGSFRFDPDRKGVIYLGHFPGGFFVSEDGGRSWKDSSAGLGNDGLFSLFVSPHDHDQLWAGSYNGVVKSADRGRTWTMKSFGMPSEQWVYTVAFDPRDPAVMYATSKNGQNKGFCNRNVFCGVVMKSTDGGESWMEIMAGLNPRFEYYNLLIHPKSPNTLFLSSSGGVFMSRDAGASWRPINRGLPTTENQVRDNVAENLAFTADGGGLLLALKGYGLWRADIGIATP